MKKKLIIIFNKTDRFGFISLKLKKPNRTQTEKNRARLKKNQVKLKKQRQTGKTKPNQKQLIFVLK